MTNGSKVLIYLTLLYFIFYCTLVSNAKGNLAKSNKSELWNRLSYRSLPYLFEVRSQSENLKKMSWDNPVCPIDAKNSIGFFVVFFLGQPGLLGDSA